ncbi:MULTISPECIES: UDP-4-amino-4,6-dideoxy-N-acetyl-beta-L-altrosamine N-acetyltransferase [Clostridium]|uniref:UDP-4-amino-4, 6-dideoxy-N-acetyl-beta-L-altrosamine N-acetyltransferase n=1 Tax=Clostridium TaxID=1485 RepID=UPI0008A130C5|nr:MULTISPECIES: UDP-4-amino-4,6-dideoxy-N-acetyl-beta-L-altrosamine N-acetyltransferase [Clostridium]OFS19729.1 UDP-4-amino-4,6-dideoxy-N-acetyl-beta-L-altrosamine N-acetyltransferase [Clostridium sp. HMSC19A10]
MSLRLRKIREDDLQKIIKWRMLPEVTKYMYTDPVLDLEKQKIWFNKIQNSSNDLYWIIEIDNTDIGIISISDIDRINKKCIWAYYIGDMSFRGRGIARALECNIYDYVFEVLKMNKLCLEVLEFNDKVISIHKKFGSEVEGILKQHICKNNKFYNVVVMGIIRDKWNAIKSNYEYEKIYIE